MIRLNCDYNEGAHPRIIKKLTETNMEQTPGYGEDVYCEQAATLIREACQAPHAQVHFLVGGTQTNFTVISAILRPHQAALCAKTGHINVHETGAVEACGHKVMELDSPDGKLTAAQVLTEYKLHWSDESHEHMTQPKMVYISHPTELGTLYTKAELEALRKACDECHMFLYLDGARLGYGLQTPGTDVDLPVLAQNCDVFYIGGTKVGALFGEAVVICNQNLQEDFRYMIKQKGGMLAKGRLLGVQFLEMFQDGLYYEMGQHGIDMAQYLKKGLLQNGYQLFIEGDSNQLFVMVPDYRLDQIKDKYAYTYQQRYDETTSVIRLCTSWATKKEWITAFLSDMKG
ncbi:MAG: aminotransferase class V-fold PLP-dependent enzyme [Lachnospiraceae bacterium]